MKNGISNNDTFRARTSKQPIKQQILSIARSIRILTLSLVNKELLVPLLKVDDLKAQQSNLRIQLLKACQNNKILALITFKCWQ